MAKNARAEAIQEMAREKARIFRQESPAISSLENAALAWKKKMQMENRRQEKELFSKEEFPGVTFRESLAKEVVAHDKLKMLGFSASGAALSRADSRDETGWAQYKPLQEEGAKEKKKEIPLNTATVVAIRKKLIAREWARALGKKPVDTGFHDLEQEAAAWGQKREQERRRKEEIRMRIARHKEVLREALADFGDKLRENKDRLDNKALAGLLEKSLEKAGEIFDIEWDRTSCLIWIEPWAEKKSRNISGLDIPVIYRVNIDENLQIVAYAEVEDEELIESLRAELLTRPLKQSLEEASFNPDDKEQAQRFLEETLAEIGRLIELESTETGWLATIEPWEEMRARNTTRHGRPPVVTDEIEIDWKDGKLEFIQEEEEENSPESADHNPPSREPADEGRQAAEMTDRGGINYGL